MTPEAPVPAAPLGPRWLLKYSREPSGVKAGPQISELPAGDLHQQLGRLVVEHDGQTHGGAVLGDQHVARGDVHVVDLVEVAGRAARRCAGW